MRKMLEDIKKIKIREFLFPLITFFAIFAIGLVFDIVTKVMISDALKYQVGEPQTFIPGFLSITLTFNKGAAWSVGGGAIWSRVLLCVVSWIVAIFIPLFIIYRMSKSDKMSILKWTAIALVWAGDIGNLIDRTFFFERGVIDFLDITSWWKGFGIFNIADSCLVVGLFMLVGIIIYELIREFVVERRKNNIAKEEIKEVAATEATENAENKENN